MDITLELVAIPVSDIDSAKKFYVSLGFVADHDTVVSDTIRFVQLTPPGSACSIVLDKGMTGMSPGQVKGMQCVVSSADDALALVSGLGIETAGIQEYAWGRFVYFSDPDGNGWALQELPDYSTRPYAEWEDRENA